MRAVGARERERERERESERCREVDECISSAARARTEGLLIEDCCTGVRVFGELWNFRGSSDSSVAFSL